MTTIPRHRAEKSTSAVQFPKTGREFNKPNMNMKTRTIANRIVILATVVLLLMTLLVGCGSSKRSKTLTVGNIAADSTVNSLSVDELTKLANMLADVCNSDFDTQEMLVAASRGYDLTKIDGNNGEFPDKGMNLEAVINVITAANAKADDDVKIAFDYDGINEADVNTIINSFKTTVDTEAGGDFLQTVLGGVGAVLRWMTNTLGFGSYLIGICLFAIIIEILMLPFGIKQQKNSIRQANLRPKETAIRNKYKGRNDQVTMQKMQQEIQEFYQRENFSPYSGCLPLLIQLPIIMALYYIVIDPLHYVLGQSAGVSSALSSYYSAAKAAGGLGGTLASGNGTIAILADIKDMGVEALNGLKDFAYFSNGGDVFTSLESIMNSIPNFNIGPFNFGLTPSFERFDILLLVPVLTFVTYFLTSKINRKFTSQPVANEGMDAKQVACSNSMMDITMPLMSTFFTFAVPALVGVYWIFRSLVGMLKQFILSRLMPLPTFTEEDYKKAAKEMAGKRVVKKSNNVGKVRSLHHIDDEDFDDTRERALARKAAIEERERQEQEEKTKKAQFGAVPMKEENKRNRKAKQDETSDAEETDRSDDNQNNNQE